MPVPDFSPGEVLTAAAMDSIGLWLVKSQDFSGANLVNVSTCFNSNFLNYRVVIRIKGSATASLYLRTLTGTTTVETSALYSISSGFRYSTGTGNVTASTRGDQFCLFGAVAATYFSNYVVDIFSPNVSSYTNLFMQGVFQFTASDHDLVQISARNAVTTALTGFQLTTAGPELIDGNIKVYGYRN